MDRDMPSTPVEMSQSDTLVEHLVQARQGDRETLGQLLEIYRGYLLAIARRKLSGDLQKKVGASDLVQETLLEAGRDIQTFEGETAEEFRGWLRQIFIHNFANVARGFRKTARRDLGREVQWQNGQAEAVASPVQSPSGYWMGQEESRSIRDAISLLPEHAQTVIQLRSYERFTFEEIGQQMQRSPEAVRKLWCRAIQSLQQILADQHDSPPPSE